MSPVAPPAATALLAAAAALLAAAQPARAQSAGPLGARPAAGGTASTGAATPSSPARPGATDPAPGVYRAPVRGAVSVQFELHGAGAEPIGVTGDTDDDASTSRFTPACVTPCVLWFAPGPHRVQLGHSPLRLRVMELAVDRRPVHVRFTRDSFAGVATGVALAGLGIVGMLIGIPAAVDQPARAAIWWSVAGSGLALLAGGVALTWLTLGSSDASFGQAPTVGLALTGRLR